MLSVVIPSRTEQFLQKTLEDVLRQAAGDVEVIVALDGYWPKEYDWTDPRVRIIHHGTLGQSRGMRASINAGMAAARGQYLMKVDEHCAFDRGFDVKLQQDYRSGWVMVPRRKRLDPDKWAVLEDGRPPVDYMYLEDRDGYLHGTEWKRSGREAFPVDGTPSMQGSCWYLDRATWEKIGPLQEAGYGPFAQEAQEIGLKAWLGGGALMVNKNTWYAHWHRTSVAYEFTREQQAAFNNSVKMGRTWSHAYWTGNQWPGRKRDFAWLAENFPEAPK